MRIEGKTAWVIGASSGIGRAIAVEAAQRGCRVAASARSAAALEDLERSMAGRCLALPLDVSDAAGVTAGYEALSRRWGPADLVVFSAGISQRSRVAETSLEVYDSLMAVNFRGAVAATLAALPDMRRRSSGHFAVISSLVGKFGTPNRSGYAASKHALHGFFDSLRAECAREGIKVTLVCPGYVRTEITRNALTGDSTPYGKVDPHLERGISVESCAEAILDAIEKDRMEITLGPPESYAVLAHRLFPTLVKRVIATRSDW